MRQKRQPEFMTEYAIELKYHPSKINVASDELSQKPMAMFLTSQKELLKNIRQLGLEIVLFGLEAQIMALQLQASFGREV